MGRSAERDRLWRLLGEVHQDGAPRSAWIVGADGLGRSALLRWLGEAAVETGAAWRLAVVDRDHAKVETALRTTRKDRPTLVLLDDADDPESQRLAASIQRPGVLVVGASRRPPTELSPTLVLTLAPLPAAAIGELLDNRLPLDRALAARIASRAAGSPGFALALLADLVRRDVLEPGPEGFRPIDGAELPLPKDLDALWAARLDAVAPPGSPQRSALEVAAILGHEPGEDLWRRACARAELPMDAATLALAEAQGWLEAVGDTVRFRLPAAREALVAGAVRSGRAPIWHGAAADALLAGGAPPEVAGRHLALAGRHADALRPLRAAAATAINATRIDECRELLELWDGSADALGLAPDDVRRASPLVVRVHLALHTDADPYPLLARAGALAAGKDPGLESQITYSHAWVLARDGRHLEAEGRYRVAIALAVEAGMEEMRAVAHLGLATSVYALGRDATELLEPTRRLPPERAPLLPMRVDACAGRGLLRLGRLADARPHLEAALAAARARGASDVEAEVAADLADAAALDGDTVGMIAHLQDAVTALLPTGSDKLLGAQVRLAAGLVIAGRDDEARALLEPLGARFSRRLKPAVVAEHALVEVALGDRPAGDLARNRERVDLAEPAVLRLLAELERRVQKR